METLDIHRILEKLPHRYPFLLVDRVVACYPGERIEALKNVSYNEPYFAGHFPQRPVMPGVMILEALAQATGILAFCTTGKSAEQGTLYYFVGVDHARFKRPVEPGDQLVLQAEVVRGRGKIWKFATRGLVDGKLVCEADIMCTAREVG